MNVNGTAWNRATIARGFWDRIAARSGLTRDYARNCSFVLPYGGRIDPWLDHILGDAIYAEIAEEVKQ